MPNDSFLFNFDFFFSAFFFFSFSFSDSLSLVPPPVRPATALLTAPDAIFDNLLIPLGRCSPPDPPPPATLATLLEEKPLLSGNATLLSTFPTREGALMVFSRGSLELCSLSPSSISLGLTAALDADTFPSFPPFWSTANKRCISTAEGIASMLCFLVSCTLLSLLLNLGLRAPRTPPPTLRLLLSLLTGTVSIVLVLLYVLFSRRSPPCTLSGRFHPFFSVLFFSSRVAFMACKLSVIAPTILLLRLPASF
mmetsp:Transcript_23435/g.48787  ORF Transcript_23435/g.48787 Transcript_23435/m.48787 type:complete len:252 (-) Transcript_23435:2365-3120(-)